MAAINITCIPCSTCLNLETQEVLRSLTKETSPEDFDKKCQNHPSYQLNQKGIGGKSALCIAAELGNLPLVKHLVKKGGKALLEHQNVHGLTPLFLAILSNQTVIVEMLIEEASPLNTESSSLCTHLKASPIPLGATPLWAAAERAKSSFLCKLLLRHNATLATAPLGETGQEILQQAGKEL